jgi:hypothetical protein
MHPTHSTVAGIYAELRHRDLMTEAERARRANAAGSTGTVAVIARATARWGAALRLIRGGPRTAPEPVAV